MSASKWMRLHSLTHQGAALAIALFASPAYYGAGTRFRTVKGIFEFKLLQGSHFDRKTNDMRVFRKLV
jgi:hypothetical protein